MNYSIIKPVLVLFVELLFLTVAGLSQPQAELYVETGINHQGRAVAFSPDGKLVAGGGIDRLIKIWNLESGRELYTIPTNVASYQLAFDPHDQNLLASLTEMNSIEIWDITIPKKIAQFDVGNYYNASFAFSADTRTLVFVDPTRGKLRSWGTVNWNELPEKALTSPEGLSFVKFSRDGKKIVVRKGKNSVILDVDSPGEEKSVGSVSEIISFSPDNSFLLEIDAGEGKINKWSPGSVKPEFVAQPESLKGTFAASYSFKGDLFAAVISAGKEDGTIVVLETKNWTVKNKLRGYNNRVEKAGILPGSSLLAVQLWYDTMKFVDLESGKMVENAPKIESVFDIVLDEKTNIYGREIFVEKNNFVVNLRDSAGTLLCTIVFLDKLDKERAAVSGQSPAVRDSHWLVATPDGFFDGTSEAQKHILWRFSRNLFDVTPVEAFYYEYYYPGLLKKVLMGEKPAPPRNAKSFAKKDFRQPEIAICQKCPCSHEPRFSAATAEINDFKADICIGIQASPEFLNADFADFRALAESLFKGNDLFSRKIFAAFPETLRQDLKNYVESPAGKSAKSEDQLRLNVRGEFGKFLRQDDFFEKYKNLSDKVSEETNKFGGMNPQGGARRVLNRMLLEDAFDGIIKPGGIAEAAAEQNLSSKAETRPGGACPANKTCLQDMRLFWNERLIQRWRGDVMKNCTPVNRYRAECRTTVPVIKGAENSFAVYLFNQDRVKSTDGELVLK